MNLIELIPAGVRKALLPYIAVIKLAICAALVIGAWYAIRQYDAKQQEIGRQAVENVRAQEKAKAETERRQKEVKLNQEKEDALKAEAERYQKLREDFDAVRRANLGLRDTVAGLRRRLPGDSIETCRATAEAALVVFEECQAEYGKVAEAADGHASDVETLSDAWPE